MPRPIDPSSPLSTGRPEKLSRPDPSWATTTDDEYAEDKFYIRHTDGKGQSASLRVTVPPELARQLQVLVESGKLPYKTKSDVIADAIHHRLHWLDHNAVHSEDFSAAMRIVFLTSEAANAQADIQQREEMLGQIAELLASTKKIGDNARLKELVDRYELEAEGLGDPWGWQLLGVLENYREGKGK